MRCAAPAAGKTILGNGPLIALTPNPSPEAGEGRRPAAQSPFPLVVGGKGAGGLGGVFVTEQRNDATVSVWGARERDANG